MKLITSSQNPYIKSLVLLQEKAKARKQTGTFLIEGKREISLAIKGGYKIDTLLFYPELISEKEINVLVKQSNNVIEINKDVFEKLAYRESTEGVIAVANSKSFSLSDLKLNENQFKRFANRFKNIGFYFSIKWHSPSSKPWSFRGFDSPIFRKRIIVDSRKWDHRNNRSSWNSD